MRILIRLAVLGLCLTGTAFADGIDEYTVLMLHFNGDDGSTDFVDDSFKNHPITAYGDAQLDTAENKFGTGSAMFDGAGDYLTVPDSEDWYFGSGDFTIDCWVKHTNIWYVEQYLLQGGSYTNWRFYYFYERGVSFYAEEDEVEKVYAYGGEIADTDWHHVALCKVGNDYFIYRDGQQVAYDSSDYTSDLTSLLYIGSFCGHSKYFEGYIDELRISKGIARWTSDFTPPTEEYTAEPPYPNNPPIAHAGPDLEAYTGDEVILDGSSSDDSDGTVVSWVWRSLSHPDKPVVAEGEDTTTIAHGFVEEIIELTVTDDRGDTDADTMILTHPGAQGPQGDPGITPGEIAVIEGDITTLQQDNGQQQEILDGNRYLLEQLPQLKKKLETLQEQVQ